LATSGTVDTTVFNTRKVIDNAYGRCRIARQEITSERIETAMDALFLRLQAMANKGIPLWAVQKEILPLYVARQTVPTPAGTVNVLNLNLRRLNRLTGTATSSAGTAENAFDGDFETICTTLANGWIQLALDSGTRVPMFGILPGASGTWSYEIQGSDDGVAFTSIYTATAETVVDSEWIWFDVEGVEDWSYYRLQATTATVLAVRELVFGNTPTEINLAPLNRDDYSSLPNKTMLSQPTQYWLNKERALPLITLWPAPNEQSKLWNLVAYVQRQIMDVGTMRQEIECRKSDYLAIVLRLSADLAVCDKGVDINLIPILEEQAERAWTALWDGESDDAPTMLTPNIGVYTA
jgi:hypothetical protein